MGKLKDLTNRRFGRLTVIKRGPNNNQRRPQWYCKCDCGNIKLIDGSCLKRKFTISCGCKKATKHGDYKTSFYRVWATMKHRCNNPNNKQYKDYGGRGISYDPRWEDYIIFKEDMYDSYLEHLNKHNGDTTIDRKDNNGNYELSNCHWATRREQNCNQSQNKLFIGVYIMSGPSYGYREVSKNQSEFARKYNLESTCISRCLRYKLKIHKGWKFKYILKED